jgi:tetratricopeptide (TPR) repeat protein
MTLARRKLIGLLVAAFAATAAAADDAVPYEEIISPDAGCREYFWEGIDAIGAGDVKAARDKLDKAVKGDDGCFLAYLLLSQLEYAEGNDEKSTEYLRRVAAEPPELDALYEELAVALRADDYEAAAAQAEKLVAAYPQTIRAIAALHLLGRAQYELGRRAEAALTLKAAYMYSDLAPGTVPAYGSAEEAEEFEEFAGVR